MIHSAVQQKLPQHWKATILQLKNVVKIKCKTSNLNTEAIK